MVIKFIDCTEQYHNDMDKIVDFLSAYFDKLNINNYKLKLSEMKIVKCSQCRVCAQKSSCDPVNCFVKDGMKEAIHEIESADAYVLLADRNSLFERNKVHANFSERLVAYHYWPVGEANSVPRKISLEKTSILINYNTTKYFMNHTFYTAKKYMSQTSTSIGAKVIDWLAVTPKQNLVASYERRLIEMANNLIASLQEKRQVS